MEWAIVVRYAQHVGWFNSPVIELIAQDTDAKDDAQLDGNPALAIERTAACSRARRLQASGQ